MRRGLAAVACLVAVLLLSTGPALADGGNLADQHSNIINITNSHPNQPLVRSWATVAQDHGTAAVTDTNEAYATGLNCTGCRTVAVAVQVVVVEGNPTTIAPQNAALAVNNNCQYCQTFAYAHQYLIQAPGETFVLSGSTLNTLAHLEYQIWQTANSNEDFPTMSSQLDQLSAQFYTTVDQALQFQNHGDGGRVSQSLKVRG